ncbi:MAG: hypothetical protein R3Y43_05295 [Alphaproteobacteria bacterium]
MSTLEKVSKIKSFCYYFGITMDDEKANELLANNNSNLEDIFYNLLHK